jgi:hypothetical protein
MDECCEAKAGECDPSRERQEALPSPPLWVRGSVGGAGVESIVVVVWYGAGSTISTFP